MDALRTALMRLFLQTKLHLYLLFASPSREMEPNTYLFRFGVPLVLKRTPRLVSTEADALRFLNRVTPHLPIARVIDTFQLDGATYTLMTRLHGRSLLEVDELSPEKLALLAEDMMGVLSALWRIPLPSNTEDIIMASASGHGLPHPASRVAGFFDQLGGPYPSVLVCYKTISTEIDRIAEEQPDVVKAIVEDPIVFVHTDLRMQNILVDEHGRLSGIVDWEDSGWLPRHWQLHMLRYPGFTCCGSWLRFWLFDYRFDDEIEKAYSASMKAVTYPLC